MARFGKFDDGEAGSIESPLLRHPWITLWSIGLGYGIFVDPSFKACIYAGKWVDAVIYLSVGAFLLPFFFLAIPVGVSAGFVGREKQDPLSFCEWVNKSRWVSAMADRDIAELRQTLDETMKNHDEVYGLNYLTEREKKEWDLEYRYREMYICNRISAIVDDEVRGRVAFLDRFKDRNRAETIWLVVLVAAIAGVAIYASYFM